MTLLGALAAAVAVGAAVLSLRDASPVERRLRSLLDGGAGRRVITRSVRERVQSTRVVAAMVGALAGGAISVVASLGPLPIAIAAYAGYLGPALAADRREARGRRDAGRAVVTLVEWLHALVASGRPIEAAFVSVSERGVGTAPLDASLRRVRRDYSLGVPMHLALAREGRASGIDGLADLATRLERSRELGRGAQLLLADLRDELRATERARGLEAASHVEGKLTLVLTLCYLPALALLVIVPLFLTLLAGLFG